MAVSPCLWSVRRLCARQHPTVYEPTGTPVTDPHVSRRLAAEVLGRLNTLGHEERQILIDTFRSWVSHGGSLTETAAAIYCHPNTVRYRLHRIEDYTRRSVTAPHDIAELCLALEIDTWLM